MAERKVNPGQAGREAMRLLATADPDEEKQEATPSSSSKAGGVVLRIELEPDDSVWNEHLGKLSGRKRQRGQA